MSAASQPHAMPHQPAYWFINSLVTVVADAASTGGSFALYRQIAPLGFATPYHTHAAYGEGFYVVAGEVTFFRKETTSVLGPGDFLYVAGDVPHGFRVSGNGPATMLLTLSAQSTFGAFVREMGEPATAEQLPVPTEPDFAKLKALSEKHGSTILGALPS